MKPKYFGDESKPFWRRVNRLPDNLRGEVYSLGCALQDLEGRVLAALQRAESTSPKPKRKARAAR